MKGDILKFVSREEIPEEKKNKFLGIVREIDENATCDNETQTSISVSSKHAFTESELDKINKRCAEYYDNYLIKSTCSEDSETKTNLPSKDNFEKAYREMCDEMEIKSHNRLIEKRAKMGWRYGERFDPEKKESPLMRQYHELPEQYKLRNGHVLRDAIDILEKHGFIVVPRQNS